MNLRIKQLLLGCVCLIALTTPAGADSLADSANALEAERALDSGDYAKAAKLLGVSYKTLINRINELDLKPEMV